MKSVEVVKAGEVEVKPFILSDFTTHTQSNDSMKTVSKKELKNLAKKIDLEYTDDQIQFAKKIITAYLAQR